MPEVKKIIELIEQFAPLETQEKWDNSGWQINLGKPTFSKIMTALTVTDKVINQAVQQDCDLILSHHPLIFEPLKQVSEKTIIQAIKSGIQIYSAHTNLDLAKGGTTDILAEKCGFGKSKRVDEFINGINLDFETDLEKLKSSIKEKLKLDCIKVIDLTEKKKIKSIAFCAGAGGFGIPKVNELGFDLYITGEVKFHEAYEAKETVVFEIGHFESERYVGEIFRKILGQDFEIIEADEKRPYKFN